MSFTYYILEKKRTFDAHPMVDDPYYVERTVFFSQEEAEKAAYADTDLYRIYSAPATLVAGTENFVGESTHWIKV